MLNNQSIFDNLTLLPLLLNRMTLQSSHSLTDILNCLSNYHAYMLHVFLQQENF